MLIKSLHLILNDSGVNMQYREENKAWESARCEYVDGLNNLIKNRTTKLDAERHENASSIFNEPERMIKSARVAGCSDARLTIYPKEEHAMWNIVYANRAVYEWMLSKENAVLPEYLL